MYATIRRIQCLEGKVAEVGRLINDEYLPQLGALDGAVSYTLVHVGGDQVVSMGLFADEAGASRANEIAQEWTGRRLGPLVASPLEAGAGEVLVHADLD